LVFQDKIKASLPSSFVVLDLKTVYDSKKIDLQNYSQYSREVLTYMVTDNNNNLEGNNMTKSELIAAVAKKAGIKNKEAAKAVETILESVVKSVAKGNDVRLVGFGTFTLVKRAARQGRNPRTGAPLKIPATKVPKFRAGKEFKEAVA